MIGFRISGKVTGRQGGRPVGLKHRSSWVRFAVVTDQEWMRNAIAAFGWISPGELRVFEPDRVDAAKAWVAGG